MNAIMFDCGSKMLMHNSSVNIFLSLYFFLLLCEGTNPSCSTHKVYNLYYQSRSRTCHKNLYSTKNFNLITWPDSYPTFYRSDYFNGHFICTFYKIHHRNTYQSTLDQTQTNKTQIRSIITDQTRPTRNSIFVSFPSRFTTAEKLNVIKPL